MEAQESLLSPEMAARLARLRLLARRADARRRGQRRIRRAGTGADAIDTRPYEPGDDPRRIAWPAYARLERLLVRVVADEPPLRLALVLDTSESMGFGTPSKLVQGARIAAGLAAVALGAEDRVAAVAVASEPREALRLTGGRAALPRLLALLDALRPGGGTDLAAATATATASARGRALCVVISDLFDPRGALCGARALRARGHEVALVEVLDPSEEEPPFTGDVVLEDAETGEVVELPPDGARDAYRQALAEHRAEVDRGAAELQAPVLRVTTAEPFDSIVGKALRSGFLRGGSGP